MGRKKNNIDKLRFEINRLAMTKEKIIEKKLEELNRTDDELIALNIKIKSYTHLLSRKEDQEKKARELDEEILRVLETKA